jgi:hypothetical protein
MLIEESESLGKKSKLANRLSKLVARSQAEEDAVAQEVEELYEVRSECIHAGLVNIEKEELTGAIKLIAKTVDALLNRAPFCTMISLETVLKQVEPPSSEARRRRWIAENAYYRWVSEGRPSGRDVQHWLEAENEYLTFVATPISATSM